MYMYMYMFIFFMFIFICVYLMVIKNISYTTLYLNIYPNAVLVNHLYWENIINLYNTYIQIYYQSILIKK
jgi:hypothetical protein